VQDHSGAPAAASDAHAEDGPGPRMWSPWRVVVGFGIVSLAADMVYEGARSVYGPLLASLGASALVVGAVTGAGEAAALIFRVVSGPLADRTGRYWTLTITGYALTAVCVPLLALTPLLGAAGLAVAAGLILAERIGKAIRSPAKSALLADAAAHVGMGRGLGVHKALDQVGAFAGPLLVAGLVAASGALWSCSSSPGAACRPPLSHRPWPARSLRRPPRRPRLPEVDRSGRPCRGRSSDSPSGPQPAPPDWSPSDSSASIWSSGTSFPPLPCRCSTPRRWPPERWPPW
jgi:MFS family permease